MKTLWSLHALALIFYGLALLFITDAFVALYGVTLSAGASTLLRFFGGVICGNAFLSWSVRDAPRAEVTQTLLLVFFVDWLITLVAGALGQPAGAMNALGWSTVGLALLWTLAFGYVRFMKT